MNEYEILIEKILSIFTGENFRDELQMAKREFFGGNGNLEEHTEQFEQKMSQFYDWYFFSRQLKGFGQTPLNSCHLVRELRFSDEELKRIETLKMFQHSLYEFLKVKNGDVFIRDLFADKKLVVKQSSWIYGFDEDQIFEARLIPVGDTYYFTRGFCFHPEPVKKYILSEIKRHRKDPDLDRDKFMLRLIKMRYKFEQYKHVKPELIYSNESKLNL